MHSIQHSCFIRIAVALCVVLTCAAVTPQPIEGEDSRLPLLDWQDYNDIAAIIDCLPAWTASSDLTDDEWKRLAECASALQNASQRDIEIALAVFMTKYATGLPLTVDDPDPRTKPLLLLSMMFDKSSPKLSLPATRALAEEFGLQWCGGFPGRNIKAEVQETEKSDETPQQAAERAQMALYEWPMRWSDKGPRLLATRVVGSVGGTGPPRKPYQPHREFQALCRMFPYRTDFRPTLDGRVGSWRLLKKQWLPQAEERQRK